MLSIKINKDEFPITHFLEIADSRRSDHFVRWHYIISNDISLYEKYYDSEESPLKIPLIQILDNGETLIEVSVDTLWTCRYKKNRNAVYLVTSSLYEEGNKYTTPW